MYNAHNCRQVSDPEISSKVVTVHDSGVLHSCTGLCLGDNLFTQQEPNGALLARPEPTAQTSDISQSQRLYTLSQKTINTRLFNYIIKIASGSRRRRFWHATHDCVAPYVDIILHRGRFWAKSAASGSVRWWCFRSCWMVLSHVMRGRPSCLLQSAGAEANTILLASALSSMRIICPNKVSRRDWIIAVSLGCFVSLCTSSFRTNWYHLMPSSIRRHHWSSASILRASVLVEVESRKSVWIQF